MGNFPIFTAIGLRLKMKSGEYMINNTRQMILIVCLLFSISLSAQVESILDIKDFNSFEEWLVEANILRQENPDIASLSYQGAYDYFMQQKDTLSAVNTLVLMAINDGHKVDYNQAYDKLWKALFLADQTNNDSSKIPVYIQLGRYYSFYKRQETALKYLDQALTLAKTLSKEGKIENDVILSCYYAFSTTHRDFNNISQARLYLDSCYTFKPSPDNDNLLYLRFEAACLDQLEGKNQQSLDSLFTILPWFQKNSPSFQVLLLTQIGDCYTNLKNQKEAESYYKKAINISKQYNSHLDFVPTIHERLSKLYSRKNDYQSAFLSLQKEKELNNLLFDSRSQNSRSLLQIKDEFRLEKEKQKQLIQDQRIANLEQQKQLSFMKYMILLTVIVSLIFASLLYFSYIRKKHMGEKALIREKRELEVVQAREVRELEIQQADGMREMEIQKATELLELKNKELATSSLKLIEKDEILATLKDKLSKGNGDIMAHDLKKILRSISNNNTHNWEEFETRFMSINKEFYNKLNAKFPKLSRGDQKLCSLVKLNLSSKEMAKLLGISIESVHTNRYRLRKKLGLSRETSLTEFIATL